MKSGISDRDDKKQDNRLHMQFVQRTNSDTGWDPQRTRQLCNYSNLPSSFEQARQTTTKTTHILLKVLSCHDISHMTSGKHGCMRGPKKKNKNTHINRIFSPKQVGLLSQSNSWKKDRNETHICMLYSRHQVLQSASSIADGKRTVLQAVTSVRNHLKLCILP